MSDVICQSGVPLLMDYMEGVLPPATRLQIDEHVAGCAKCLAFISSYQRTPAIVRAATGAAPPSSFEESLLARLRQARR